MIDISNLHEIQKRDGDALETRDDDVDEILSPSEKLGKNNELPLLDREYDDYPEKDDLFQPNGGKILETLANHPLVSSPEDMNQELKLGKGTLHDAIGLHGVEIPEGGVEEGDRLTQLIGKVPEKMIDPRNPIIISTLYLKGLSIEEIAEVLREANDGSGTFRRRTVRQILIDLWLVEGKTTAEIERDHRQIM